ncbi:hypothetical protein, partial [Nocardioides sp.]|uniref:hypothetical protein n=1 Tax=Nocardioides sp. TaxID=35761 RepID=UPI002F3F733F
FDLDDEGDVGASPAPDADDAPQTDDQASPDEPEEKKPAEKKPEPKKDVDLDEGGSLFDL